MPEKRIPGNIVEHSRYDEERLAFGRNMVDSGLYAFQNPVKRPNYHGFGTIKDTLVQRINAYQQKSEIPLFRVHVGPYNPDKKETKKELIT